AKLLFVYRHSAELADDKFRGVAEEASRRQAPYYEAVALNGRGMIRLKESHFDEAIPWFQRTAEAAKKDGAQRLIVAAGQNLAICYSQLGSFEEAVNSRREALRLLGETGLAPYRMELLGETGNTYVLQRDPRKGIDFYRQALTLVKNDADAARFYRNL